MVEEIANKVAELPLKHQIGKTVVGAVAGLLATRYAKKGYDVALECITKYKNMPAS